MRKKISITIVLVVALVAAIGGTAFGALYGTHAGFPIAKLKLNGQEVTPPSPAVVINGTTYVPLRFVANAMGAGIGWDQATETVSIDFAAPAPTPTPVAQPSTGNKIGDTIRAGAYNFTVHDARFFEGSEWDKPKSGMIYLVVDVSLENVSSESQSVSSLMMFKVADADGYVYSQSLVTGIKDSPNGTIPAGRKVRGEIGFEVPRNASGLELVFIPDLFGNVQIIVPLR